MYPLEINNNDEIKDESKKKTFTKMLNKNEFFGYAGKSVISSGWRGGAAAAAATSVPEPLLPPTKTKMSVNEMDFTRPPPSLHSNYRSAICTVHLYRILEPAFRN